MNQLNLFIELTRLKKPIGYMLLFWPCIWGLTIAYDFSENFSLYLGIYDLANLFENEGFLILIWTHFLAINLFCGAWIVRDSQKYLMSKYFNFIPLIITYFIGPLGIIIYWIIRIFFAKKISLFD